MNLDQEQRLARQILRAYREGADATSTAEQIQLAGPADAALVDWLKTLTGRVRDLDFARHTPTKRDDAKAIVRP